MTKQRRAPRTPPAPRQAIGYLRVSTHEQAISGLSIEAQRKRVVAQAELSELKLVRVLADQGESAATLDRPAMKELIAAVDSGQVDVIIIAKLDRLTRSITDLASLMKRMKKARRADGKKGVDLISSAESLDTGSATGRLVVNIMASVSQWEREVIAERTSVALQELKAQGKTTGNPPFGFQAGEDGVLVDNEREQAILDRMGQLREEGQTWQAIADTLTRDGERTRRGNAFSKQGLIQIARGAGLR